MKKLIIITFFLVLVLVGMVSAVEKNKEMNYATWLWDTKIIQTEKETILRFLADKNITNIYLQFHPDLDVAEYQLFIQQAKQLGVDVYILGGSPEWVVQSSCKECESFMTWIESYQKNSHAKQRFTGVHVDIEPYLLPEWGKEQAAIIENFQQRLTWFKSETNNIQMEFDVDIPFWFDDVTYHNAFGNGNLSEWIISTVDRVAIMAYRNKAKGDNGIIQLVKTELQWAEDKNKEIIIAVETINTGEKQTSFYGKGRQTLANELDEVVNILEDKEALWGIGVHDYHGWKTLME